MKAKDVERVSYLIKERTGLETDLRSEGHYRCGTVKFANSSVEISIEEAKKHLKIRLDALNNELKSLGVED